MRDRSEKVKVNTHGLGNETPASICAWSRETFGIGTSNLRYASRANEEMAEAVRAFASSPNSPDAPKEAVDVIIILCVMAENFGIQFKDFSEQDICKSGLSNAQLLMDANMFMAQLLDYLVRNDNDRTATHWIYGCYEKLCWFIRRTGREPQLLINEKMAFNRERKWVKDQGYTVRAEKVATKTAPFDAGWVRMGGDFLGWPIAVPVACPATAICALERALNSQREYSLSTLIDGQAIEAGAVALMNAIRRDNGVDGKIDWNSSGLSPGTKEKYKRHALDVLCASIAKHGAFDKLDAVGVDSAGGVGKVHIRYY